ncbi:unnamed protein product [Phytomonas sp. Hart1]|nr:unnamed protein product [Phytomonas sp. Hart1]|eukprot:CCW71239.1 unnamed protein product [Phytomonas sp. isolate Hart1]
MTPRSRSRVRIVSPNTSTISHSRSISIVPSSNVSTYTSNEHERNLGHQVPNPFSGSNRFHNVKQALSSVDANIPFQTPKPNHEAISEPLCDYNLANKAHYLNGIQCGCSDHFPIRSTASQHAKGIMEQTAGRNILKNCTNSSQRRRLENAGDIKQFYMTHENSLNSQWQPQSMSIGVSNSHTETERVSQLPTAIPIQYEGYGASLRREKVSSSIPMASQKRHCAYSATENLGGTANNSIDHVKGEYKWERKYEEPFLLRLNRPAVDMCYSKNQYAYENVRDAGDALHAPPSIRNQDSDATTSVSVAPAMFRGLSSIHVTDELFDTQCSISITKPASRGFLDSRSGTRSALYRGGDRMKTVLHEGNNPKATVLMQSSNTRYCLQPLWCLIGTFKTPITAVVNIDYGQGCLRWKQRNPKDGFQMIRISFDDIQDSVVAHIMQEDEDIREKQFTAVIRTSTRPSQVVFGFKTLSEARQMCSLLKKS